MTAFDDAAERVAEGADPRSEADALVAMMTLSQLDVRIDGSRVREDRPVACLVGFDAASARPV
ncbi:MAG: hypothetical protein OXC00_08115 [Acidimicrobiaceae bacterium]|nr:hypothetical protein [Acidimicrobiaceae bacterium]